MNKKELKQVVKEDLKSKASYIRKLKGSRKMDKREGRQLWEIQTEIDACKYRFRVLHVAYCIFFNHRTLDQIECSTSPRYYRPFASNFMDAYNQKWGEMING